MTPETADELWTRSEALARGWYVAEHPEWGFVYGRTAREASNRIMEKFALDIKITPPQGHAIEARMF